MLDEIIKKCIVVSKCNLRSNNFIIYVYLGISKQTVMDFIKRRMQSKPHRPCSLIEQICQMCKALEPKGSPAFNEHHIPARLTMQAACTQNELDDQVCHVNVKWILGVKFILYFSALF